MNTLNVAICEDNRLELTYLLNIINESTIPTTCTTFNSGEDFIKDYEVGVYDLIYMDIYMKGMTGIDTIKTIREVDPNVLVAFTTTSLDFTLESYRLDAIKYIEKPVSKKAVTDLLELALLKSLYRIEKNEEKFINPYINLMFFWGGFWSKHSRKYVLLPHL